MPTFDFLTDPFGSEENARLKLLLRNSLKPSRFFAAVVAAGAGAGAAATVALEEIA